MTSIKKEITQSPIVLLTGLLCVVATPATAQTTSNTEQQAVQQELDALLESRQELARQMEEFDRRIQAIESRLESNDAVVVAEEKIEVTADTRVAAEEDESWGPYEPGKGFVLARGPMGELNWDVFSYARYLNQQGLDDTYTDAFGRTSTLDLRNDIQFQKVTMNFKGWLFDPDFRYLWYIWTSNTSQGDPAQVVVAGNLSYKFSDKFTLAGGIGALPTTRSTNYTFPNWLKNDHRSIADEFFRG